MGSGWCVGWIMGAHESPCLIFICFILGWRKIEEHERLLLLCHDPQIVRLSTNQVILSRIILFCVVGSCLSHSLSVSIVNLWIWGRGSEEHQLNCCVGMCWHFAHIHKLHEKRAWMNGMLEVALIRRKQLPSSNYRQGQLDWMTVVWYVW